MKWSIIDLIELALKLGQQTKSSLGGRHEDAWKHITTATWNPETCLDFPNKKNIPNYPWRHFTSVKQIIEHNTNIMMYRTTAPNFEQVNNEDKSSPSLVFLTSAQNTTTKPHMEIQRSLQSHHRMETNLQQNHASLNPASIIHIPCPR